MDDLVNFRKSLAQLKTFVSLPIKNDRHRFGIIQAFEFTFEQAWKAIQKRAGTQGVEIGNPKSAFMYAMKNQWLSTNEEQSWLQLLKDRNQTSHTYEEILAKEVLERIQNVYVRLFEGLVDGMGKI